jgi:hypothetical protein
LGTSDQGTKAEGDDKRNDARNAANAQSFHGKQRVVGSTMRRHLPANPNVGSQPHE